MKRAKIDSLIIVMIPIIPQYDSSATHHGATGEEEDRSYKNMLKTSKDLLVMAKEDLEFLQRKQERGGFGKNFSNAILYPEIIFLGQVDGKNSISEALEFIEKKHNCKKDEIKNLGINITAHGNPSVIGTKLDVSIDPDGETCGLASLITCYIENVISKNTRISFYLLSCNSGYVSYSEDEDNDNEKRVDRIKKKLLHSSYAGRFFGALAQEFKDVKISVSGYRGFLSHSKKKIVSMSSESNSAKIADAECVRIVFSNINNLDQFEVEIPKNYKFNVLGVKSGITSQQAIDHMISPVKAAASKPLNSLPQAAASDSEIIPPNLDLDVIDVVSAFVSEGRKTLEEVKRQEEENAKYRMQIITGNSIFSDYLQNNRYEIEFIVKNPDWFEYVMEYQDQLEGIISFLNNTGDLSLFQVISETFAPLDILIELDMTFEELEEYFTYNFIYMILSNQISLEELIEIKRVDENLFELLGCDALLGSLVGEISVRDAIKTYIEMAKTDRQLNPVKIFEAAINYESGQIDRLPFQLIECSDYYIDLKEHKATEILDDSDLISENDDEEVVIDLGNYNQDEILRVLEEQDYPNSNSLSQIEFRRLAGIDLERL